MCCIGKGYASWHNRPLPYQMCGFSAVGLTLSCDFTRVHSWNRHSVPMKCCTVLLLLLWLLGGPAWFFFLCLLIIEGWNPLSPWSPSGVLNDSQSWTLKVSSFCCASWKLISLKKNLLSSVSENGCHLIKEIIRIQETQYWRSLLKMTAINV